MTTPIACCALDQGLPPAVLESWVTGLVKHFGSILCTAVLDGLAGAAVAIAVGLGLTLHVAESVLVANAGIALSLAASRVC